MVDPPALKPYPAKLVVETTTRCNLACPMCLKHACEVPFLEADMARRTLDALAPALPTAEVLVLNGIGEPLLLPHLEDIVRTAKARMPSCSWVGFQTNGLLMDEERAAGLVDAGLDRICLSIDAVDPEGFRLIRRGGELAGVERAMNALRMARTRRNAPLHMGIEFVLRRDNLAELPGTIRWAGDMGADFALVTQLFPYHPDLVGQTVYDPSLDASLEIFEKYEQLARTEGIDLRKDYPKAYMHYTRTDRYDRVRELVDAMMAEALGRGVSLNLSRLFVMDNSWKERTAAVFEEARLASMLAGIDLRLPGIVPRSARRCEFVEEGCSFVSVHGDVHPCYFLWHRARCYIGGIRKDVGPLSFGNLHEKGILEIWNDPAYVTFRSNVLRYDYPFCFNCSFALCDYVEGETFEQDCYINTEPCGACLWCMDVFQCLK
jgi:putative metalloenzyme radical SAM/SPASM domain maturase